MHYHLLLLFSVKFSIPVLIMSSENSYELVSLLCTPANGYREPFWPTFCIIYWNLRLRFSFYHSCPFKLADLINKIVNWHIQGNWRIGEKVTTYSSQRKIHEDLIEKKLIWNLFLHQSLMSGYLQSPFEFRNYIYLPMSSVLT